MLLLLPVGALGSSNGPPAQETQHFVHSALGISMDLPAGWRVIEMPTGFLASPPSGQSVMISTPPEQPEAGRTLAAIKQEHSEMAARRSQPGDEMLVEDLEHPRGEAFAFLRRSAAGDRTQIVYSFFFDVGGKVWNFNCVVRPADDPDPLGEICMAAARSFRAE